MICAHGIVIVVCVCACVHARLCTTPGILPSAYILMNLYSTNIIFTVNEADSLKRQNKVLI